MRNPIEWLEIAIPFLESYPAWVKISVSVWVFATAALVIVLLFSRGLAEDTVTPVPSVEVADNVPHESELAQSLSKEIPVTFEQYVDKLAKLDGRFLELSEYQEGLKGSRVVWEGYVRMVTPHEHSISLSVGMKPEDLLFDIFHATFSEEFRTKIFSLRKGDHVRVTGELDSDPEDVFPNIRAELVELLDQ